MKHARACLTLLAILLPAGLAAQTPNTEPEPENLYRVEVIVFRLAASSAGNTEIWPPVKDLPDLRNAVLPGAKPDDAFRPLAREKMQLAGVWDRLESSERYEPLLHVGWIQPALDRDRARQVRITLGERRNPAGDTGAAGAEAGAERQNVFTDAAGTDSRAQTAPPAGKPETEPAGLFTPLDGGVTIISNLYLYANLDLLYTPDGLGREAAGAMGLQAPVTGGGPIDEEVLNALARGEITLEEALSRRQQSARRPDSAFGQAFRDAMLQPEEEAGIAGYRLAQNRRIRLNELHYFDHPVFGVLLVVSPVQADEADQTEQEAN